MEKGQGVVSELFDSQAVSVDSPRKKWLVKHSIKTLKSHGCEPPWSAWAGDLSDARENDRFGYGETEKDAICDWAKEEGVRLWNEE